MIPDFGTWYAEQRFKPGTRVRVINGLHYHGREGVVARYDSGRMRLWVSGLSFVDLFGNPESFEVIDDPS